MYGHNAIVRRISILAIAVVAAGAVACGRAPAGSASGGAEQGTPVQNAQLTEFEYAGQRPAPQSAPQRTSGAASAGPAFDPVGPALIP